MLESLANKAKDRIGQKNPFPKLNFPESLYGCKWGLTDLYPQYEKIIREAIEKRETFDTDGVSCQKEIRSFRIISDGEKMTIQAFSEMDEWPELIYDALWDVTETEEELTDEQIEELTDYWNESLEMNTETQSEITIPVSTYEAAMETLETLEEQNEKQLNECFEIVKSWVKEIIDRKESEENSNDAGTEAES